MQPEAIGGRARVPVHALDAQRLARVAAANLMSSLLAGARLPFEAAAARIPVSVAADGDVSGIQSHPLVTSAVAVGDATAIQPVVSTLVFGFAFENLLIGAGRFHRVSQIFLELTVSL